MSLNTIFRDLEDKIDDLQRDTKFCINSYDYHHKNNEYELLKKFQDLLNECALDGREFLKNMDNMRMTIETARKECLELDEMLKEAGISATTTAAANEDGSNGNTGNCSSTGQSISFREDDCEEVDDNKENMK